MSHHCVFAVDENRWSVGRGAARTSRLDRREIGLEMAGGLGGELFAGGLASGGLACGLLGTSHDFSVKESTCPAQAKFWLTQTALFASTP